MKNTCLTFAALFIIGTASAQTSPAETTVQKMFAAFKAKDKNAFLALYPNAKQFGNLMRSVMKAAMSNEEVKKQMAANPQTKGMNLDSLVEAQAAMFEKPEMFGAMSMEFVQGFEKAISSGEGKGVNWAAATLSAYTIDSTASLGEEMAMLGTQGFKAMKGNIEFKSGGNDYTLAFDKVMWVPTEGQWLGGEFGNVLRKGEVGTEMMPESERVDSAVAVEPKPKAKTKTKSKTPAGKTKTKTKSAARKTTP